MTEKNRKYFITVKEIAINITEEREKNYENPYIFFEQLFKCVKIIFLQIYVKTGRGKTHMSKVARFQFFLNIS